MKRGYIFNSVILLFFSIGSLAQSHIIDTVSPDYPTVIDDTVKIKALNDLAFEYIHSDPQLAKDDVEIALSSSRNTGFRRGEAQSFNVLGSMAWAVSDYPEALNDFFKSLEVFKELQDQQGISMCYNNIGEVYKKLSEYDKSLSFLRKAKKLKERYGDNSNTNLIAINIGEIYVKVRKYDSAEIYFKQGLKGSEMYSRTTAYGYNGLANVNYNIGNYDSAIFYHSTALAIRKKIHDKRGITSSYLNLANCYIKTKNIKLAKSSFDRALASAYKSGARDLRLAIYEKRSGMYELSGNLVLAINDYKKYTALKDSLFSEEKAAQIVRIQASYETELLKKEKLASLAAIKQRNIIIAIVIILFILMAVLAYGLYKQRKMQIKVNQLLTDKNNEIQMQSEEIHAQSEKLISLNRDLESLNEGLEDKIKKRTTRLREHNKLLAEYAYISAHEVRAPVATLLGLINLLKYSSMGKQDQQILKFLKKSTDELDEVIRNIRTKLENKSNEWIDD